MPRADCDAATATIQVNIAAVGQAGNLAAPTLIQVSQLAFIWETAQLAAGVRKFVVVTDRERAAALLATAAAALAAGAVVAAAPGPRRTVLAELTVDQTDRKTEFAKLDTAAVTACYDEYHVRMGGRVGAPKRILPMPDREPSADQLSALAALRDSQEVIYVDLAVRCPFASRAKRKRTFSGYTLGLDGELHVSEIKGPLNL